MKPRTVIETRRLDLCISCELCAAVCPANAIYMGFSRGQYLPVVEEAKCTGCGLCYELCPGIDIDPEGLRFEKAAADTLNGQYRAGYTGFARDLDIRWNSTSGGALTAILLELVGTAEYEQAYVVPPDIPQVHPVRLTALSKPIDIFNAAKSKYLPTSLYNLASGLGEKPSQRSIIVSTPCVNLGIRKLLKHQGIPDDNLLLLGLFCDRTYNHNSIRYFESRFSRRDESLTGIGFRTKENSGWPGNTKLVFSSGREQMVDRAVRMQSARYLQLNRCRFCLDKLNRSADISFGDCYIPGKGDIYGKSSIITRTEKGETILDRCASVLELESERIEAIINSQGLSAKLENLENVKSVIRRKKLYPDAAGKFAEARYPRKTFSRWIKGRQLALGRKPSTGLITFGITLNRAIAGLKTASEAGIAGIAVIQGLFTRPRVKKPGGGIVIVGGGMSNKGAQSMTFTVIDEIRERFPEKEITLLSSVDFGLSEKDKAAYKVSILPWEPVMKLSALSGIARWLVKNGMGIRRSRYPEYEGTVRETIRNAEMVLDISGYALSSRLGLMPSADFLINIMTARKYSVPYYVLPQSFGPFNYPLLYRLPFDWLMKRCLDYPDLFFTREIEGKKRLDKYRKREILLNYDIVLRSKPRNHSRIFNGGGIRSGIYKPPEGTTGIIPNTNLLKRGDEKQLFAVYGAMISQLLEAGKTVCVLGHSYEDKTFCQRIKNLFPDNDKVILVTENYNALELEQIISGFEFIIGSRYHGIIHAYRHGVPAIVIGWANKYQELLEAFGQDRFSLDCSSLPGHAEVHQLVAEMLEDYPGISDGIKTTLQDIDHQPTVFDIIFGTPEEDRP